MLPMITDGERGNTVPSKAAGFPFIGVLSALVFILIAFAAGLYIGKTESVFGKSVDIARFLPLPNAATAEDKVNLAEFWEVWSLLDEKFVSASSSNPLSNEDRIRGAIAGMVAAYGDPYTTFFPPQEAARFEADIAGNFSGVGMEVGMRKNIITIIAPLPGTPAERAGLVTGDAIVKINDKSTEGMAIDEAVRLIRGE